jgi:hypothetical protein
MYVLSAYVDLEKIGMFELVRGELWKASDMEHGITVLNCIVKMENIGFVELFGGHVDN